MNRYKCDRCGKEFDELDFVTEPHGEKVVCCPYCHGWFEEVYECKICGEHYTEDELYGGVCDGCIYENVDLNKCFQLGADCEESIAINGFIASVFDTDQINYILMQKIKEAAEVIPLDITGFIEDDKTWIGEKLVEKEKENF